MDAEVFAMASDPNEQWAKVRIDETLVGRRAGGSAADNARELRDEAPVRSRAARLFRRHTSERAWRKGANGERVAGWWLKRLPEGSILFNDVPVGERGANIDHVVVGPGGVFTVNTKNLSRPVWVGAKTFRVGEYRTDYLPKAVGEADRASRLLSAALGREINVRGSLAVIADKFEIEEQPGDVMVGSPRGIRDRFLREPEVLTRQEIIEIAGVAAKPTTWREAPVREGSICSCGGEVLRRERRKDGRPFLGCSRFPECRRKWPLIAS